MNVFLDYKINNSGKGKFLKRLIPELEQLGVKIKYKPKGCDVALGIVYWNTEVKIPKILRIDGIHLTGDNEKIRKSMKKSNAIIFQSEFAKNFIKERISYGAKKEFVIYNGAPRNDKFPKECRLDNIMVANWGTRKHKRLDLHVKFAEKYPDEDFYLIGKCNAKKAKNLKIIGELPDKELQEEYMAKYKRLIYLADLDWCPNVVVEAIMAGMEIIHNPKCKAVTEMLSKDKSVFDIKNVAKQYKKAFNNVSK